MDFYTGIIPLTLIMAGIAFLYEWLMIAFIGATLGKGRGRRPGEGLTRNTNRAVVQRSGPVMRYWQARAGYRYVRSGRVSRDPLLTGSFEVVALTGRRVLEGTGAGRDRPESSPARPARQCHHSVAKRADVVVHMARSVDYTASPQELHAINADGAAQVTALAEAVGCSLVFVLAAFAERSTQAPREPEVGALSPARPSAHRRRPGLPTRNPASRGSSSSMVTSHANLGPAVRVMLPIVRTINAFIRRRADSHTRSPRAHRCYEPPAWTVPNGRTCRAPSTRCAFNTARAPEWLAWCGE
ncbi:hypothetical protein [Streptomyces sp. NPDC006552]|uniref:hypothetical protein n=1 Tax=Streptomyces sp. NPDC006552 TaxID=3157179 RepID=UPI0033B8E84D